MLHGFLAIVQNGIKKVVYARMYSKPEYVKATRMIFKKAGVKVCRYKKGASQEELEFYQKNLKKLVKSFAKK